MYKKLVPFIFFCWILSMGVYYTPKITGCALDIGELYPATHYPMFSGRSNYDVSFVRFYVKDIKNGLEQNVSVNSFFYPLAPGKIEEGAAMRVYFQILKRYGSFEKIPHLYRERIIKGIRRDYKAIDVENILVIYRECKFSPLSLVQGNNGNIQGLKEVLDRKCSIN